MCMYTLRVYKTTVLQSCYWKTNFVSKSLKGKDNLETCDNSVRSVAIIRQGLLGVSVFCFKDNSKVALLLI